MDSLGGGRLPELAEPPRPNYVPMLQAMVEGLQDRVARLERENRELRAENATLRKRVEELQSSLGAAPGSPPALPPFAKPPAPKDRGPKKPGRKPGHPAALRPPPAGIDRTVDVPLPTRSRAGGGGGGSAACLCPDCRGELRDLRDHERLVEDVVPATVRVTRYRTRSGYCKGCRRRVESRAPDQPPAGFHGEQPHARLGLNALARAAVLHVENRLPLRQVAAVMAQASGLKVSAGALARQAQRLAGWMAAEYERVKLALRASAVVHCDGTGGRVGGGPAWLWGVCAANHDLYHFDARRAGAVARELLGEAFGGRLVTDFYSAYTRLPCKQQKCLVHLLRELRDTAAKDPAFAAGSFRRRLRRVLKEMLLLKLLLKGRWDELADDDYITKACRLWDRLEAVGKAGKASADPDERRVGRRVVRWHKELAAFLFEKGLDGTNNAAERAMIHAVVARKISGGHRSWPGAHAWAVLASIARTARKQGRDVLDTFKRVLTAAWAGREPGLLAAPPAAAGPSP
jgi:hypothetical protein